MMLWCVVATVSAPLPAPPRTSRRSSATPRAAPSEGSVPVPSSSRSTRERPSASARSAWILWG
jgi:hypothetical protein